MGIVMNKDKPTTDKYIETKKWRLYSQKSKRFTRSILTRVVHQFFYLLNYILVRGSCILDGVHTIVTHGIDDGDFD